VRERLQRGRQGSWNQPGLHEAEGPEVQQWDGAGMSNDWRVGQQYLGRHCQPDIL